MRYRPFMLTLVALTGISLVGCASNLREMTAKMEDWNANRVSTNLRSFPDPALASTFVTPEGKPSSSYLCQHCALDTKGTEDRFDFLIIERDFPNVDDKLDLAASVARAPIERSDVGLAFIRNAKARGHSVAVYGASVNAAILGLVAINQSYLPHRDYPTNVSSSLVEIDQNLAFVSTLAVMYETSQGVLETNIAASNDVFVRERIFVFPQSTARYVQERLADRFTSNYRIQ